MNAQSKPGVLAAMDYDRLTLTAEHVNCCDADLAIHDEARATVERLAEDAEAMLADLELDMATAPASSFRMVTSGKRVATLRAALAAFRGEQS